jgi:galactokinase
MTATDVAGAYHQRFGLSPSVVAQAPGRVNLIGEHTDTSEGFVFPAAIDRRIWVAARVVDGPSRLVSDRLGDAEPFDTRGSMPGDWSRYPAGMARVLAEWAGRPMPNLEAYVASDLPLGSGLSSSAAIEMAFGVLWRELIGLDLSGRELARLGQRCEHEHIGVQCGIMDQMASALGRAGHALFIDTRNLDLAFVQIPAALAIVVCDTMKPRELSDSAYNERRRQTAEAASILGVGTLRDLAMEQVDAMSDRLGDPLYRRARHVVTENDRCQRFVEALGEGEIDQIYVLMRQSHESLRDDFEVSCPELDAMAEACWQAPGCIGARMTGAGFGGACVALVERERTTAFREAVSAHYLLHVADRMPRFIVCESADGAAVAM